MKLIVCLDDKNGMSFNGRRQSTDSAVTARILELVGEQVLYINGYSKKLFGGEIENIVTDDRFLDIAGRSDYCFAEITDVSDYLEQADEIVIFRWNRVYPADMYFPVHLLDSQWKRKETYEFTGSSHQKITQEVYYR